MIELDQVFDGEESALGDAGHSKDMGLALLVW